MSVCCDDGEQVAYYRETRRTARKQHDCCACEIQILPGHTYWVIAACWDGRARRWKRCDRCQFIHQELRAICGPKGEWPDEELNCGHTFEEAHDREPPEYLAALAFWQPGDVLPHVAPCTPSLVFNYERAIVYRVPYWGATGDVCRRKPEPYWGIEGPRPNNETHAALCSEAS